jgi:hypothetical protein
VAYRPFELIDHSVQGRERDETLELESMTLVLVRNIPFTHGMEFEI